MKDSPLPSTNPLYLPDEENLEWLELGGERPEITYNPLDKALTAEDPIYSIVETLSNEDYLSTACKLLLNIEILPFQAVILDKLWTTRFPLLVATRGGSKSYLLAVYGLLRLIFHQNCRIAVVGAAFRQSRQVFEYMCDIWHKSPVLQDIAGDLRRAGPKREIDRCEFRIGDSVAYFIPLGTGEKIRGLRANYILSDEMASISEDIFNIVVRGFGVTASSPVEKVKEASLVKQLKKMGIWSKELEAIRKKEIGGNQVVYSGTAYFAYNHFARYFDKWRRIIASRGDEQKIRAVFDDSTQSLEGFDWKDYCVLRIPYTCTPEGLLDAGIIAQSKASMTTSQFLMEYGACFPKDSDGFYKRSIIDAATTNRPIQTTNGDKVQFSALRTGDKSKSYVMGVDPAADQDNAAIVILELGASYRKVVHCWTTNRKRYNAYKKIMSDAGTTVGDDYYRYIAKKIRSLMSQFNIEHIIMDKNGGGTAIEEALASKDTCAEGEHPVFPIIDPEEPKQTDMENGVHILEMLAPTMDINRDANHGMLKDLQDKALLFPLFDTVELAKSVELDNLNNVRFDTYEDLVLEIEDLKTEITSIVCKPSSTLGKETFDTPDTKMPGQTKKGRMRKDRYSALLYANFYSRNKDRNEPLKMHYVPVGGTKATNKGGAGQRGTGSMYTGPGLLKFGRDKWISGGGGRVSRK